MLEKHKTISVSEQLITVLASNARGRYQSHCISIVIPIVTKIYSSFPSNKSNAIRTVHEPKPYDDYENGNGFTN